MKRLFTALARSAAPARPADYVIAAVLVLVPFHAFLTVWAASLVGHYVLLRLWCDVLLVVLVGFVGYWLARDRGLREWLGGSLLVRLIGAYAGLSLLLGLIALLKHDVTVKALGYGLLVNLRFLVWFVAVLLAAQRSAWLRQVWPRLLLIPAAVVVLLGAAQYTVLPHNFLAHFGYNAQTNIAPIETINHNSAYIRVQSTLRGANPLGAYLVVVLSAVAVLYTRGKRRIACGAFGLAVLFVLYASGSRSAWIGAVLALGVVAFLSVRTVRQRRMLGGAVAAVVVLAVGAFVLLRADPALQNHVLHTQTGSTARISSNGAHLDALKTGVKDVLQRPFGDGPGTAGPASVYNTVRDARISENYYVQVAQETGWLGLALFVGILALTAQELYARIRPSRLALVLLASLVGVSLVNLLSHAWTDPTLAYLWWGLAGIALAMPPATERSKAGKQ